ncbi:MAG: DNA polymerase IV [Bacteroidia bacterium]
MPRKIIHIDMDAFYASVEQRDFPEYRGKPLIVGGNPDGRGVVSTCSYEARKFGVRSAMSSRRAKELCPEGIFVYPRFHAYKEASKKVREIFERYTDLIEPLSLDEAFLDVTENKKNISSAIQIAKQIKTAIQEELNLTASAGVSSSKFVAKIASDMNKPDGLTYIAPEKIEEFMERLPVEKFFGVGKVTADKMKKQGLHKGIDLKQLSEDDLVKRFGKVGRFYYRIVRGIDNREIRTSREHKSLGAEDTFREDLCKLEDMKLELEKIADTVSNRLQKNNLKGRTLTLKIKYHNFQTITRNQSFKKGINDRETLYETACTLLEKTDPESFKIRLLGISLSNFGEPEPTVHKRNERKEQLKLF